MIDALTISSFLVIRPSICRIIANDRSSTFMSSPTIPGRGRLSHRWKSLLPPGPVHVVDWMLAQDLMREAHLEVARSCRL
jgi:hypothetical protein